MFDTVGYLKYMEILYFLCRFFQPNTARISTNSCQLWIDGPIGLPALVTGEYWAVWRGSRPSHCNGPWVRRSLSLSTHPLPCRYWSVLYLICCIILFIYNEKQLIWCIVRCIFSFLRKSYRLSSVSPYISFPRTVKLKRYKKR